VTLDWGALRGVRDRISLPLILAGGLNAGNVGKAIELLQPYAVDVISGVERRTGEKDPDLIREFVAEAAPLHQANNSALQVGREALAGFCLRNLGFLGGIVPGVGVLDFHGHIGINALSAKIESGKAADALGKGHGGDVAQLVGLCLQARGDAGKIAGRAS
jgi:hypothetical protein